MQSQFKMQLKMQRQFEMIIKEKAETKKEEKEALNKNEAKLLPPSEMLELENKKELEPKRFRLGALGQLRG